MDENVKLVKAARHGDAQAFAKLYEEVYEDMYRFALYTLKNTQDAEDMVSETVEAAFASIRKLRTAEAFKGWIFRILSNKCREKLREYARRTVSLEARRECSSEEVSGLFHAMPQRDLEEQILVRKLFFELEEEERLIIGMHVFGGYKSREIAELLSMNENTVRSKESRGLKKMAGKLGGL